MKEVSKKIRILLVDDDENILNSYVKTLKKIPNFQIVGTASDGKEAIDLIDSEKPDVLVLDIILPVIDGIGVMKYIDKLVTKKPKVIITSGISNSNIINEFIELGVSYYLIKPFLIETLIERITQLEKDDIFSINDIDKEVEFTLNNLGIPIEAKAYKYIKQSIIIIINEKNNLNISEIYAKLSEMYGASQKAIEKSIRDCIEKTFRKGNLQELNRMFEYRISLENGKVSNKTFIYGVAQSIMYKNNLMYK